MTGARLIGLYVAAYIVFLYLPVALIPLFSVNDAVQPAFPLKGFTLGWYAQLLETPAVGKALRNSVGIALTTAALATLCGTTIAYADVFLRSPLATAVGQLARLPILIPGVIAGIALLILVNLAGLGPSRPAMVMGHLLVCLPARIGMGILKDLRFRVGQAVCSAMAGVGVAEGGADLAVEVS